MTITHRTPDEAALHILGLIARWFHTRVGQVVMRQELAERFILPWTAADFAGGLAYAQKRGWVTINGDEVCLQQAGEDTFERRWPAARVADLVIYWFHTGVGQVVMREELAAKFVCDPWTADDLEQGLAEAAERGWIVVSGEKISLQQTGEDARLTNRRSSASGDDVSLRPRFQQ